MSEENTISESSDSNSNIPLAQLQRNRVMQVTSSESSDSLVSIFEIQHNPRSSYSRISSDKKKILIKCFEDGKNIRESAEIAGIKLNTAKWIINEYNKNDGMLIEKSRGGKRNVKLNPDILSKIERLVEQNPCLTLKKIRENILETERIQLSISSVRNGLKKLRITLKCASVEVDRRNCARIIEERKVYALHFSRNAPESREKIIFIDESGFNYHLRRTKARSKVNTPARVIVPTVRGRNVSLIAAINTQGIVFHDIIAHSTVTSIIFSDFLRSLFQKLEEHMITEAWLILDNVRLHKTREIRDLIAQTRHTLVFLPPYSPMMNPIEEVFSKIKFFARNLLADCVNSQNLIDVIEQSVATVTPGDCNNYYTHMYMQLPLAAAGEPL